MKWRRLFKIKLIVISLVFAGAIMLLNISSGTSKSTLCKNSAEFIHVKLGEHVFAIPYRDTRYINIGEKLLVKTDVCYQLGDTPVEATGFNINSQALYEKYNKPEIQFPALVLWFNASLYKSSNEQQDLFVKEIKPLLKRTNIELQSLPQEQGFYVIKNPDYLNHKYYIAIDKKFTTASGNPVVFNCQTIGNERKCWTTTAWRDGVNFSFNHLSDLHIEQTEWKEFYYDFLDYMESLEVKANTLNPGDQS